MFVNYEFSTNESISRNFLDLYVKASPLIALFNDFRFVKRVLL